MGELEPLSDGLHLFCGVLGGWGGAGIRSKCWFATCRNHRGREPVVFIGHSVEGKHDPGYLINPSFGRGSLEQASAEHVIQGPVAPLVNGVAFRMIR